ncbi:hypothetical protein BDQ12DRAFT_772904 [Crucibulum laeve]|uniref:F-box domain-containing protein n=1 Tax=Crucibulum laeve TaxID=68775 RepID=A0A5C3LL40_9AGAR|nr:hypothetical protein BDQ12DRAFT_772904 [Crucibulum laeve]
MAHHLNLIPNNTVPYDIVLIIVDNSDLPTRIACSQVNKEWASLLRGPVFGPHLTVTANQFSNLLTVISDSSSLFNNVLQYTKGLTVIDNDGALKTEDMIALCTPHVIEVFSGTLSLELYGPMTFTSFTSFTKFVCFFPALDSLSLSNVRWKENSSTVYTDIPMQGHDRGCKSLRMCLELSRAQIITVLLWSLVNNITVDVRVLKIDLTFMPENDHLLRTTSFDNLRTLQLSNINPLLNITNNTLISVLHEQIKSITLEHLTLTIFAYNKSHLERLPWWTISTILTDRKEYSSLKRLEIVVLDVECPSFHEGIERFLQQRLGPFVAKQMLSIKFHESF